MNEPKKPMVVRCNWCLAILTEPGALVFTPPDEVGRCNKIHVCVGCYARVIHPGPAVAAHEVHPAIVSTKGAGDADCA